MPTIKIHVEAEELAALRRRAEAHKISVENLVYGAINCSMSHCHEDYCVGRIATAIGERAGDLPRWADSARSVAIYEGQPDIGSEKGPKSAD